MVEARLGIIERRAEEATRRMEQTLAAIADANHPGLISGDEESRQLCPTVRDSIEWYCQHRRAIVSLDPTEAVRCASFNDDGSELGVDEFSDAAVEEMLSAKCDALNLTPPRRRAGEQSQISESIRQQNASPSNRLLRLLRPPLDPPRMRLRSEGTMHGSEVYHIPSLFELEEEPERLQSPPRERRDISDTLRISDLHF
ncbi:hypothetical protein FOZ63_001005 [Perkinsus olseni]|uniref:Uncharacterized protein n=1 Tax=Perkinsus olseni TaxID=32597 RepID=A0A7J6QGH7_PEROL|nr:hypothetical protein FOZ63_001005 [Perkinsus olseni]